MANRFMDGFDHYLVADILKKWTASPTGASGFTGIDPLYSRPGSAGKGIRFTSQNGEKLRLTLDAQATWVVGFAMRFNTSVPLSKTIVVFRDSAAAEQCSLRTDATGKLQFTRSGTVLGTAAAASSADTWYYIETKVTIGNSGSYEVRVNGSAVIGPSSGDTQQHASEASATAISIAVTDLGASTDCDDLYINDGTGGVNDTFWGPIRIVTLRPNNAGSSADWVTGGYGDNFANVQDDAADGDTTFNMSSTPGDLDLYELEDMPSGTIKAVQTNIWARQDAGAARTIRPVWKPASTNRNGATVGTSGSYLDLRQNYDVSPETSSAWTDTEINGSQLGVELVS